MVPPKPFDRTKLVRAGKVLPQTDTGDTLDAIANTEVVVVGVTFEPRTGRTTPSRPDGKYTMTVIALDGGKTVHTGSEIVREQMQRLLDDGNIPCLATFGKVRSTSNPTQSYWSILPDSDEE